MLTRNFLRFSLLAALCGGCGSIHAEHTLTGRAGPAYGGDVQIVMEGAKMPEGIREIAIVQVVATGNKASLPSAVEAIKARSAQLGCNIVVNVRIDRGSSMSSTGVCGFLDRNAPRD